MHFCFDLDDVLSDTYSVLLSESLIFHCNVLNRPRVDRKVQDAYGDYFYFAKSSKKSAIPGFLVIHFLSCCLKNV